MIKEAYRRTKILMCFLLFFAMLSSLIAKNPAHCEDPKTIYLDPTEYRFGSSTPVGTKFNVTVWAMSDVYPWKLMMFQVYMTFNDTLINSTQFMGSVTSDWSIRAWPNQDLGDRDWDYSYVFKGIAGGAIGNPIYYHLGSGEGAIMIGDLVSNDLNVSAPKKLCTIEFEIKMVPSEGTEWTSILGINSTSDTYLYDFNGPISGVVRENGSYVIPEFSAALLVSLMVATVFAAVFMEKLRLIRANKKI
jgi:hypothetical protein